MKETDSEKHKWLSLQFIRGIAAIVVVVSHLIYWNNHAVTTALLANTFQARSGEVAVAIFFCLSGIVITSAHYRELGSSTQKRSTLFSTFWIKRIFRIYPVYWFFGTLNFILYHRGFVTPDFYVPGLTSIASIIKAATLLFPAKAVAPAWSLTPELFFYFLFSLLFLSKRIGWIVAALCLLLAISNACQLTSLGADVINGACLYFALGVGLFHFRPLLNRVATLNFLGFLFWIPLFVVLLNFKPLLGFPNLPLTLLGAALLFSTALSMTADAEESLPAWSRTLGFFLGDISYSLYLGHFPVQMVLYAYLGPPDNPLRALAYVLIPMGIAWMTCIWLEKPLIRFSRKAIASKKASPASPLNRQFTGG